MQKKSNYNKNLQNHKAESQIISWELHNTSIQPDLYLSLQGRSHILIYSAIYVKLLTKQEEKTMEYSCIILCSCCVLDT